MAARIRSITTESLGRFCCELEEDGKVTRTFHFTHMPVGPENIWTFIPDADCPTELFFTRPIVLKSLEGASMLLYRLENLGYP